MGDSFGYTRANTAIRLALYRLGVKFNYDAQLAIHFRYPDIFETVPGKINCLFTMYESEEIPGYFARALDKCDAVIAPSKWNVEVFRRYTKTPVYHVPLGVNLDMFKGIKRSRPRNRPFRWLWIGAHNMRKGWKEVVDAWTYRGPDGKSPALLDDPRCELYMKTTHEQPILNKSANVTVDSRRLMDHELLMLYADADGFVFPSMGDAWGLTVNEALATALPVVTCIHTGITDFADDTVCRPVKFEPTMVKIMLPHTLHELGMDDHLTSAYKADVKDLVKQMRWVMDHWVKARDMGIRGFKRARQFTWEAAGKKMIEVLEEIEGSATENAGACATG